MKLASLLVAESHTRAEIHLAMARGDLADASRFRIDHDATQHLIREHVNTVIAQLETQFPS